MSLCVEKQTVRCGKMSRTARLIAIDENTGKLAVVRKSKSPETHDYIEFHNILSGWLAVPELTICPENGSIENVMFVKNGELMTSHANGSVCFIDPHNATRIKRIQVSASTIWAACVHTGSIVAMVSHSSVLYFFDASTKTILSSVSLGVESRLFDVASNGSLVAIGSIDGVIIVGDGKIQRTLKIDRQNRRDPTIAWSVRFVTPGILACGDSRGTVTLWDPIDGSLNQSISVLQSHILTMCVSGDGILTVGGVDPRITDLKEVIGGQYEIVNRRNGPKRDVRSLAVYENTIYAAGEDFDIFVGKNGAKKLVIQQMENIKVAGEMVGAAGDNYIDVFWKQNGEDQPSNGSDHLTQHYEMIHLAKIYTPKKRVVTCWTLSPCGSYLAIGTCHETTVYKLSPLSKKGKQKVTKVDTFDLQATSICITKEKKLFLAKNDFEIVQLDIDQPENREGKMVLSQTDCGSVIRMCSSPCSRLLCVLTSRSQIFSINTENGECRLLKVDLPIDISISSGSALILSVVSSSDSNPDTRKILHEVGISNGLVRRSASSHQLRMIPTNSKSVVPGQPIALFGISESKIMAVSAEGHWAVIDMNKDIVVSAEYDSVQTMKKKHSAVDSDCLTVAGVRLSPEETEDLEEKSSTKRMRTRTRTLSSSSSSAKIGSFSGLKSRVVLLKATGDETPKTAAFKLKKFGMQ